MNYSMVGSFLTAGPFTVGAFPILSAPGYTPHYWRVLVVVDITMAVLVAWRQSNCNVNTTIMSLPDHATFLYLHYTNAGSLTILKSLLKLKEK